MELKKYTMEFVVLGGMVWDITWEVQNKANYTCGGSRPFIQCFSQVSNESVLVNNNTYVELAHGYAYLSSPYAPIVTNCSNGVTLPSGDYDINETNSAIISIDPTINNTFVNVSYYYYDLANKSDPTGWSMWLTTWKLLMAVMIIGLTYSVMKQAKKK